MGGPVKARESGIDLVVRLTPKSSADALEGLAQAADGSVHLKARVRTVPERGAANAALEKLLAKTLGVPLSTVAVVAGGTSRLKTVHITGDTAVLTRAVERLGIC